MCARYTLARELAEVLRMVLCANRVPHFTPRFNIAPQQFAPVFVRAADGIELRLLRWGLIPSWAKDEKIASKLINARSESLLEKPSFRQAFRKRRCLVPADGFYEWETTATGKVPHWFSLSNNEPFCFAGLWEEWKPPNGPAQTDLFAARAEPDAGAASLATYTVVTTAANEVVKPLHDRMPVILPPEHYGAWLDPATPPERFRGWLREYPAEMTRSRRVSTRVNNPRHEGPDCLEEITER